jgi:hypothetical protein
MKYSKKYGSLAFDFHTREFLFLFLWDWLAVWTRLMTFDRKSNIIDESSRPDTSPNVVILKSLLMNLKLMRQPHHTDKLFSYSPINEHLTTSFITDVRLSEKLFNTDL